MKIAKGGISWILFFLIVTLFLFLLTLYNGNIFSLIIFFLFFLSSLITLLLLIFFRDPERRIGKGIVAVADGSVREIANIEDEDIGRSIKISTFMNIHNVHVNRMPTDGKIIDIIHYNGTHIPAFKKESDRNERVKILINTDIGLIKIIQITGTLARRIVPYVKKGDKIDKGKRIGIIRLGSRVDIFLPQEKIKSININVKEKLKAGEDSIAEIHD
jgi:phosphatidylserine decarboxylase